MTDFPIRQNASVIWDRLGNQPYAPRVIKRKKLRGQTNSLRRAVGGKGNFGVGDQLPANALAGAVAAKEN